MALARSRRATGSVDYWPGFVDALSTLLLAIIFLLSVFVLAQFVLSQEISDRDTVLDRLNAQINELTEMLSLERAGIQDLNDQIGTLEASLDSTVGERDRLQVLLDEGQGADAEAEVTIANLSRSVDEERALSERARAQVDLLNQQLAALRRQIGALEAALEASEERAEESDTRIQDLSGRLNVALAQRVQELARYRSDFFGRLREILSNREDIRVVGDRFVFQSEVLFGSGGANLDATGQAEMAKLADAVKQLAAEIPEEIEWVLRVDGHTDNIPLSGRGQFEDNWALSTARAAEVVRFLTDQGVPADRLAATGFGEYQPIDPANTIEARARNRRIELKLTER